MDTGHAHEIEAALPALLERFYARVRADRRLGPVFNDAVEDWDRHLQTLTDFWSSVMLASGRYKGHPVQAHLKHGARITPDMFGRWLELWNQATDEILSPAAAAALQVKATRIAQSLDLALHYRPETDAPRPAAAL